MTVVARSVRSLLSLLLLAPPLVAQAADPAVTNKLPSSPSQQQSPKATPAESLKRIDPPIVATTRTTNVTTEPNLQEILRAAHKANTEARQIVIGNLVNANTPTYKRQIASFATVLDGSLHADGEGHAPKVIPASYFVGARLASPLTDMRAGKLRRTGRELDLAIEGEGFFWVEPSDQPEPQKHRCFYYARGGSFVVDRHGNLAKRGLNRNWILMPRASFPDDATKIEITKDGVIWVNEAQDDADAKTGAIRTNIGNMQLHTFPTETDFVPCGDDVFMVKVTGRYQPGLIGTPGMSPRGVLRQGYLEDSNVDPQQEFETLQKLQEQAHVLEQAAQLLKFPNGPMSDQTKPLLK